MEKQNPNDGVIFKSHEGVSSKSIDDEFKFILQEEIEAAGGELKEDPAFEGSVGVTMFDVPSSKDNLVPVVIPLKNIQAIPSQSIIEIRSRSNGDGRIYRGIVVEGPFYQPDGIRADSPIIVTTSVRGTMFMPKYHGRILVEVIGELKDGVLMPPRFRPLPNSPVFVLSSAETAEALNVAGDVILGTAIGHEDIKVGFFSKDKNVLPRHLGILGTTGGGKSTTLSGLITQFQKQGIATIIIDTEGEYTHIDRLTEDNKMKKLLEKQKREPEGVQNVQVYHLTGRETRAEDPTLIQNFKLTFSSLSPYSAAEILDLTEPQFDRFLKAYDVTKLILRDLNIYPKKGTPQEREVLELDEFESGYPHITLSLLIDICGFILAHLSKGEHEPFNYFLKGTQEKAQIKKRISAINTSNEISWKALLGKLWRLQRIGIFDKQGAPEIPFENLIKAGKVSIFDLSDTDSTIVNNLVIANLLRGILLRQENEYEKARSKNRTPTPTVIIIEEAHEFLSRERISKMHNLFEQVARIARRGRKRWLGLVFVTQLPQHLPDEVLGLINNFIFHKIGDDSVISRLKRSIGGVDDGLWKKLTNLAPGQAIVKINSLTRSLMVAIDPTPCKLLMVE